MDRLKKIMKNFFYKSKRAFGSQLAILCYHRVEDYITDPVKITVSKNNFLKQIDFLDQFANIINPDQLFDYLKNKRKIPRRSILLTFDDGYASYRDTMELLKEELISAIFFISLRKEKYWWDILSRLLLENQHLKSPELKKINYLLSDMGYQFQVEEHIDSKLMRTLTKWDVTVNNFPFNRNKAFYLLAKKLEEIDSYHESKLLKIITSLSNARRDFSYLKEKHLTEHHKIGFHTINHFNLSKLSYNDQRKEIELGKKHLDSIVGKEVEIFAYPYGGRIHYNETTLEIVRRNFNFAFSNFEGLVYEDSNVYELPRFLVRDWKIDKFIKKIKGFFGK